MSTLNPSSSGIIRISSPNCLITSEPNSFGEIKIDKMTQSNRIDPVDAIIDAWKVWFLSKQNAQPDGEEALQLWLGTLQEGGDKE